MQGLKIFSVTGSSVGQFDIDAAHRVANTFQGHGFGTFLVTDKETGTKVEYHAHKNMAFVDGSQYYVTAFLPSPWRGRSVMVGQLATPGTELSRTVMVCADDGETLYSSVDDYRTFYDVQGIYPSYPYAYPAYPSKWIGSGKINVYIDVGAGLTFVRQTDFSVPLDCVYPEGQANPSQDLKDRRILWSVTMTNDTMAWMDANVGTTGVLLWNKWDIALKSVTPSSRYLYRSFFADETPLTESVVDTLVSRTTFYNPPGHMEFLRSSYRIRRDATVQFALRNSHTADEYSLVSRSLSYVGYHDIEWDFYQASIHRIGGGYAETSKVTHSYSNWYVPVGQRLGQSNLNTTTNVPEVGDLSFPLISDRPSWNGSPGSLWNGSETGLTVETYGDGDDIGDAYGSDGISYAWHTRAGPYPTSCSIQGEIPEEIREYLRLLSVTYQPDKQKNDTPIYVGQSYWMEVDSIAMAQRSVSSFVTAFLFGAVKDGISLGAYWLRDSTRNYDKDVNAADAYTIDGVDVFCQVRFRFDEESTRFIPVGLIRVLDPDQQAHPGMPRRVLFDAPQPTPTFNSVVRFSGLKFADMQKNGAAIMKYLRQTDPDRSDFFGGTIPSGLQAAHPIIRAVLSAVGDL